LKAGVVGGVRHAENESVGKVALLLVRCH
jgi:hypothetical protein